MPFEAPITVRFVSATRAGDFHPFRPLFVVEQGGVKLGEVWVLLTSTASVIGSRRLGAEHAAELDDALLRYGVDRLARQLSTEAGINDLFPPRVQVAEWTLDSNDLDDIIGPLVRRKRCAYQQTAGRDLFCCASGPNDLTAQLTIGHRRAAPTSRPLCSQCALPDERVLCSRLGHPQSNGIQITGAIIKRDLMAALCDDGHEEVEIPEACRAGRHGCWRLDVWPTSDLGPIESSPLSLPEALDFLDSVWRLAFGNDERLARPSTFADSAGLASSCSTADQFEARVSDLADALDRFIVPERLLPDSTPEADRTGSLNRLRAGLIARPELDGAVVDRSVRTLQRIRRLRNSTQHSGVASERPRILAELGLADFAADWPSLWRGVQVRATEALLSLRSEVRKLMDIE